MATPVVSGIAGLVKAQTPSLTPTEIKSIIESTVDSITLLSGKVATGGRVNTAWALIGERYSYDESTGGGGEVSGGAGLGVSSPQQSTDPLWHKKSTF